MQVIKYKDTSGNIQSVQMDLTYPVEIIVPNDNTEWTLITTDPGGSLTTDHEGRRPKK